MYNATTGIQTPPTTGANSTFFDGSTAEYIDERNYLNGSQPDLRNFSFVTWNHASAWSKFGTAIAPGNTTHIYDYIVNSSNKVLASLDVGMASSISWTDYWHGCE